MSPFRGILFVFNIFLLAKVNGQACPEGTNVAQMCMSGQYTANRVLIDTASYEPNVGNCTCSFTTTSSVLKIVTYMAPNYPQCNSAIRLSSSSGNTMRFQCLMSGTYLDTSVYKEGSAYFETYADFYDKNYCLVLEHAGSVDDTVTVTCSGNIDVNTTLVDVTTSAGRSTDSYLTTSSPFVKTQPFINDSQANVTVYNNPSNPPLHNATASWPETSNSSQNQYTTAEMLTASITPTATSIPSTRIPIVSSSESINTFNNNVSSTNASSSSSPISLEAPILFEPGPVIMDSSMTFANDVVGITNTSTTPDRVPVESTSAGSDGATTDRGSNLMTSIVTGTVLLNADGSNATKSIQTVDSLISDATSGLTVNTSDTAPKLPVSIGGDIMLKNTDLNTAAGKGLDTTTISVDLSNLFIANIDSQPNNVVSNEIPTTSNGTATTSTNYTLTFATMVETPSKPMNNITNKSSTDTILMPSAPSFDAASVETTNNTGNESVRQTLLAQETTSAPVELTTNAWGSVLRINSFNGQTNNTHAQTNTTEYNTQNIEAMLTTNEARMVEGNTEPELLASKYTPQPSGFPLVETTAFQNQSYFDQNNANSEPVIHNLVVAGPEESAINYTANQIPDPQGGFVENVQVRTETPVDIYNQVVTEVPVRIETKNDTLNQPSDMFKSAVSLTSAVVDAWNDKTPKNGTLNNDIIIPGNQSQGFDNDIVTHGTDSRNFGNDVVTHGNGFGNDFVTVANKPGSFGNDMITSGFQSRGFGNDIVTAANDLKRFGNDIVTPGTDSRGFGNDFITQSSRNKSMHNDIITHGMPVNTMRNDIVTKATVPYGMGNDIVPKPTDQTPFGNDMITKPLDSRSMGNDMITKSAEPRTFGSDIVTQASNLIPSGNDIVTKSADPGPFGNDIVTKTADPGTFGNDIVTKPTDSRTFGNDIVTKTADSGTFGNDIVTKRTDSRTFGNDIVTKTTDPRTFVNDIVTKTPDSKTFGNDIVTKTADPGTFGNDIVTKRTDSKTFGNDIVTKTADPRTFENDMVTKPADARTFGNDIVTKTADPNTFGNDIVTKTTDPRTFGNDMVTKPADSNTFGNDIVTKTADPKTFGNDIVTKTTDPRTFVNDTVTKTPDSKTFGNDIVTKTADPGTFGNDIVTKRTDSKIFGNDIVTKTADPRTFENDMVTKPADARTFGNDIVTKTADPNTFGNDIVTKTTDPRTFGNDMVTKPADARTFGNDIVTKTADPNTFGNDIVTKTTDPRTFGNDMVTKPADARTFGNDIVTKTADPNTFGNDIVTKTTDPRTFGNDMITKPADSRTFGNDIVTKPDDSKTFGNDIVTKPDDFRTFGNDIVTKSNSLNNDIVTKESEQMTLGNDIVTKSTNSRSTMGNDIVTKPSIPVTMGNDFVTQAVEQSTVTRNDIVTKAFDSRTLMNDIVTKSVEHTTLRHDILPVQSNSKSQSILSTGMNVQDGENDTFVHKVAPTGMTDLYNNTEALAELFEHVTAMVLAKSREEAASTTAPSAMEPIPAEIVSSDTLINQEAPVTEVSPVVEETIAKVNVLSQDADPANVGVTNDTSKPTVDPVLAKIESEIIVDQPVKTDNIQSNSEIENVSASDVTTESTKTDQSSETANNVPTVPTIVAAGVPADNTVPDIPTGFETAPSTYSPPGVAPGNGIGDFGGMVKDTIVVNDVPVPADTKPGGEAGQGRETNVSFDTGKSKGSLFEMNNDSYIIVVGAIAGLVVLATVIGIFCHNSRKRRSEKVNISGNGIDPTNHQNRAFEDDAADAEHGNNAPNGVAQHPGTLHENGGQDIKQAGKDSGDS